MEPIELAKQVLANLDGESFHCSLYASEGGTCGDGWNGDDELYLSADQIRYLLKDRVPAELLKGLDLEEVDVDAVISNMAEDAAFPEPVYVSPSIGAEELDGIIERIQDAEDDDPESIPSIMDEVEAGEYTISFGVYTDGIPLIDDCEATVALTRPQALSLLLATEEVDEDYFEDLDLYDGDIEDLITEKLDEMGVADDYNPYSAGGDCEILNTYLDARVEQINMILNGEITEEQIPLCDEYFSDSDNYDGYTHLSSWLKEQ